MDEILPSFKELSTELWKLLDVAENWTGKSKKKRTFENLLLKEIGWLETHDEEYKACKNLLQNIMEMTHYDPRDPTQTLCLLTDASQRHHAAMLTVVSNWKEGVPVYEQDHRPLKTFSGEFKRSEINWSTIEKESYPIIQALKEWRDILMSPQGFRIYSDHENLVSLFKPEALNPELSKSALDKVYRWLYSLSSFRIISMEHLARQHNLWADMLSRWAQKSYRDKPSNDRVVVAGSRIRKRNTKYDDEYEEYEEPVSKKKEINEFLKLKFSQRLVNSDFPDMEVILEAQKTASESDLEELSKAKEGKVTTSSKGLIHWGEKVWIPVSARGVIYRILIAAHCGIAGHRGGKVTWDYVNDKFHWLGAHEDCLEFNNQCLSCEKGKCGDTVPRPLGETICGSKPGSVVHADFLYMGTPSMKSEHEFKYLLVLKDSYSHFVDMIPCRTCSHVEVVNALLNWESTFRNIEVLVTDRGSHFKNLMMEEWAKHKRGMPDKGKHHFTFAYCPWANGSVERVNRTILDLFKVLRAEALINVDEWIYLKNHVKSVLNKTPSTSLNGYSPLQVFTGMEHFGPLDIIFHESEDIIQQLPPTSEEVMKKFMKLREHLEEIHKDLDVWRDKQSAKKSDRRKADHRKYGVDFDVGDFVMLAVPNRQNHHKIVAKWRGPYKVTRACSDYIYEVTNLSNGLEIQSHISRLKFFCDADLDNDCALAMANEATLQDSVDHVFDVESILEYDVIHKVPMVLVKWLGLSTVEGTWQDLKEFNSTCPDLVDQFIENADLRTSQAMRRALAKME